MLGGCVTIVVVDVDIIFVNVNIVIIVIVDDTWWRLVDIVLIQILIKTLVCGWLLLCTHLFNISCRKILFHETRILCWLLVTNIHMPLLLQSQTCYTLLHHYLLLAYTYVDVGIVVICLEEIAALLLVLFLMFMLV